uniref:Uncharacterized protein n=1 Tax=Rhizophora mucronata TaxID=61149 RepID=A0A2P2LA71_RHIMU
METPTIMTITRYENYHKLTFHITVTAK